MTSSTTQTVQSSFFSSCSKPRPEIDVFLSFRGEDTGDNFTDHLYHALKGKGFITFKDDTKLEPGNPISVKVLDAIEKSRISVIVFSKNYASSPWCLDELVKIVKCMKGGLRVLPIFYHVDPNHVQHQNETFALAFDEHEKRLQENPEKVQIWRDALRVVANLSGKTLTNGPETEFIGKIVDGIFTELKDKGSIVYEESFVGIGSRVKEMNSCLDMNSNDVRFIGICGKSGMGKTTLARVVFDKICDQFEACSFLENVEEVSKARGLEALQEKLLCDISNGALRVMDVYNGIQVIRNVLRDKKVLIVVDDVCKKRQLETLVGKCDWFGPKSRIIVTTEDEMLLKSYAIQIVCKVNGLDDDEALKLFSHNAYHKAPCENHSLDMGNDFVTCAQGSPLLLKVLGSYLCKREKEDWESSLNQLKAIPDENILGKLQIAVDGLKDLEKSLFLDIACFFIGEDQNRVANILESVCYTDDSIQKLVDKSLVTIVGGKFCMHRLIQQMGWKIVYGESMELGSRSRLWHCDDVLAVLKNNIGTDRIEGIELNLTPYEEREELNADSFLKMTKLRYLKICKLNLPPLRNLSNELRFLEWHEYPLKSLPKSFQPRELVELIMHRSSIKQLPREFSHLYKLKLIDLSDSQNLYQTPNFSGLPNIERLIFQGCTGLHELHPSVGGLKRLILLNLKDCKSLENLSHEIKLESLTTLILSGCSKIKKLPKFGRNMTSMSELYLDGTAIEELPSSIMHLTDLTSLNINDCKNLSIFPSVIPRLISLEILSLSGCKVQPPKPRYLLGLIPTLSSIVATLTYLTAQHPEAEPISLLLPKLFSGLSSLVILNLSDCNLLDGALPGDFSYLSSLKSLDLSNNNFTCLPHSISQLLNLKLLYMDHCSQLQSLPYLPLSTQFVSARGCTSLENYSNQVVVWSSGETVFTFINCLDLADDEEGKIVDVSFQDIHFQALWRRYIEDQINQIEGFCLVLPQTEIPECFKNKECGPSVRIPLPSNLSNNRSWKGIALCVIFVVPKNLKDVSPGQDSNYFREFICHFDIDGDLLNCPLVAKVPKETYVGSFGLWLYVSHARFTAHLDEGSCISSLIRPKRLDIQIKMCGACILYDQDMVGFVRNLLQNNFGSHNYLNRHHEKFIEDHMSNSQSRKLKSLLSRLYQVNWAQNHLYDYIFHQIARPTPWFTCKNLGPHIELQLPPGVHDDSKWLGFTVYAFYGIQMQRAGFSYKLDSTIFLSHYSLSASDEVSSAPCTAFSLSGDVFVESSQDSQRLVVFYIPRRVFQLNRCSHIKALFKSGDPGVQVEMCDIRLVYEQDVEEFVQTLVEYMLGSPDANHQSFSEHLSHQLGMLQGCNHEKHYLCPFLPESRTNPMPKLLQEECTLRETFPNQVIAEGTSKNSSPGSINLGISFGNGQCGSNMSGSLKCWFKPYLQNLDKLKHIDLSHSQNLIHTPDFIGVPNIQTLIFQGCTRLHELHPSVGGLKQFNQVNRKDCKRLENLPHELNLESLQIKNLLDGLQPIEAFLCSYQVTPEPVPVNLLLPMAFSGLRTLVSLDLSDCNLLDGALPDLSYLCSLKFLKLSKNNFTYLPDSISELSKLKILFLDHCAQLKSFPYLPLSTQFVSARGCILLENYSNRVVVWTSGEAGFTIIDFLGLTVDEGGKITELSFLDIQHQPLWQRFIEKQIEGIYGDFEVQSVPRLTDQSETNETKTELGISDLLALDFDQCQVYNSCFPLCEILEWFNHRSDEPQLTIPLPPNVYNDSTWMGLALFASVAVEANQTTILDIQNSETSYSLVCHLETSIDCVEPVHVHHITKEDLMLLQEGGFIWLSYIPRDSFKESLNQCSQIEASITINCPGLVQKCGFHLLYKHDELEFKETRQYATVVFDEQELSAKISSSSNEDPQSEPVELADWKDKGKRVEY